MSNRLKKNIAVLLGVSPLFLMSFLFTKYAVNIPHWDDHALKGFILDFEKAKSMKDKAALLFAQHNEHRIFFTRVITWLLVKVNGSIDYRQMMLVGNASLIGVWVYFIQAVNKYRLSAWYIAISGWLLFSLAAAENIFWGMAAIQNFWVIFWAFSTFYLLTYGNDTDILSSRFKTKEANVVPRTGNRFMLFFAMLTATLALLTSGNGLVVPLIGLFILIVQKRKRTALLWGGVMGLVLLIHFTYYESRPDVVNEPAEVTITNFILGICTVAGALFDTDWSYPQFRFAVTQLMGGILLLISAVLFVRRLVVPYLPQNNAYVITKRKTDLFMSAAILFVWATIAGIVLSRSGYGMGVFLTGKYKIYGVLLLIICVLYLGRLMPKRYRKAGTWAMTIFAILLWINSYFNDFAFVINQNMERRVELANWYRQAEAKGETLAQYPYRPPASQLFNNIDFNAAKVDSGVIDDIQIYNKDVVFTENDIEAVEQEVFFVLKSTNQTYFFSTQPQRNKSRWGIFKHYFQNGFTVTISQYDVATDFYLPYVYIRRKDGTELLTNGKLIRIDGLQRPKVEVNW